MPLSSKEREAISRLFGAPRAVLRVGVEACEPAAQYVFALRLYHGEGGVLKNLKQAAAWFRISAEQGFASAQGALGTCLWSGIGVEEDRETAVAWWRLASESGQPVASFALGECYERGLVVPRDDVRAHALYTAAAAAGNEDAKAALNRISKFGFWQAPIAAADAAADAEGKEARGPSARIKAEFKAYAKWLAAPLADLNAASVAGDPAAQCVSGHRAYQASLGAAGSAGLAGLVTVKPPPPPKAGEVPKNKETLRKEEEKAAEETRLGRVALAVAWYRKSGEAGFALANGALALLYFNSEAGEALDAPSTIPKKEAGNAFRRLMWRKRREEAQARNRAEAERLYRLAAEAGLPAAQLCVGDSAEAQGRAEDNRKRIEALDEAKLREEIAARGEPEPPPGASPDTLVAARLAVMGRVRTEAVRWYRAACAGGNDEARAALLRLDFSEDGVREEEAAAAKAAAEAAADSEAAAAREAAREERARKAAAAAEKEALRQAKLSADALAAKEKKEREAANAERLRKERNGEL